MPCAGLAVGRLLHVQQGPTGPFTHDLGASRDGVWEVFNDGLVNSMCVKKRQINLTALV